MYILLSMSKFVTLSFVVFSLGCGLDHAGRPETITPADGGTEDAMLLAFPPDAQDRGPSVIVDVHDAAAAQDATDVILIVLPYDGGQDAAITDDAPVVDDVQTAEDVPVAEDVPPPPTDSGVHCTPDTCNPASGFVCTEVTGGGVSCCQQESSRITLCADQSVCGGDFGAPWECLPTSFGQQCCANPARTWGNR